MGGERLEIYVRSALNFNKILKRYFSATVHSAIAQAQMGIAV